MADDQAIEMERGGVTKQVSPKLYKYATEKGWKRTQSGPVQSQAAAQTQAKPQPPSSRLKRNYDKFIEGAGFNPNFNLSTGNMNPLHTPPSGMESHPGIMGGARDVGEDMLNLREIGQLGKEGRKEEGFSMIAGTIAGLLGPKEIGAAGEAMRGPMVGGRRALTSAGKREAAEKAIQLVKRVRGNIKDARLAEETVQPIREALNAKYDTLHKALEKEIIPINTTAQRILKRIAATKPKLAEEIGDLMGRTALDYNEAKEQIARLHSVKNQSTQAGALLNEIDKEIDKAAAKFGMAKERAEFKAWYKRLNDVTVAAHTSIEKSVLRNILRKLPNVGKYVSEGGGKVGDIEMRDANRLYSEITGKVKSEAIKKVGKAVQTLGKAWQRVPPGYRALLGELNSGDSQHDTI